MENTASSEKTITRRPKIGETVEVLHRTQMNMRSGGAKLVRCKGKPEVKLVTAVYREGNRVRVSSGEFWDVIPCKNSTATWQTAGIGGKVE